LREFFVLIEPNQTHSNNEILNSLGKHKNGEWALNFITSPMTVNSKNIKKYLCFYRSSQMDKSAFKLAPTEQLCGHKQHTHNVIVQDRLDKKVLKKLRLEAIRKRLCCRVTNKN
jgi:hypothetical protein